MTPQLKRRLERGLKVVFDPKTSKKEETGPKESEVEQESLSQTKDQPQVGQERREQQRATAGPKPAAKNGGLKISRRKLNALNSMMAIKLKMLLFMAAITSGLFGLSHAGFFTFYFPNVLKPKGFGEMNDMIAALDVQINETLDSFSDTQYFWGQLQRLDTIESDYPEESACSEVFPLFREQAIAYTYADFEYYIMPMRRYKETLIENRDKWYPLGQESTVVLPRIYEQLMFEEELKLKIESLTELITKEEFRNQRGHLNEIWKNVRRSLDTSLPCVYLRYAYRQVAQDINQVALETNLEAMKQSMVVLQNAYKRIEKYRDSDQLIIDEIAEELKRVERFTIQSR